MRSEGGRESLASGKIHQYPLGIRQAIGINQTISKSISVQKFGDYNFIVIIFVNDNIADLTYI